MSEEYYQNNNNSGRLVSLGIILAVIYLAGMPWAEAYSVKQFGHETPVTKVVETVAMPWRWLAEQPTLSLAKDYWAYCMKTLAVPPQDMID